MSNLIKICAFIILATYSAHSQNEIVKLAESQQEIFSVDHLLKLNKLSEVKVSPDEQKILYSVSSPLFEENKYTKDLFLMDMDGSNVQQLTNDNDSENNLQWRNDSKAFYYLGKVDGKSVIFEFDIQSKSKKTYSLSKENIAGFIISPDGKKVAYISEIPIRKTISETYPNATKSNALKYDYLPIRHWDHWEDEKVNHIFIENLAGGGLVDVLEGEKFESPLQPFGGIDDFAWSPDSKSLTYVCIKAENTAITTNSDIYLYELSTKKTTNLTDGMMGYDKSPTWSADGQHLAFTSMERDGFEADKSRLFIHNIKTNKKSDLTANLDQWAGNLTWASDSKSIYFTAGSGDATEAIYKVNIADSKIDKLTDGNYNDNSFLSVSKDNNKIIFGRTSQLRPTDLFSFEVKSKKYTRLTKINDDILSKVKDVKMEARWVKTSDGKQMHTWVLYPPNFDPKKKYPMITYCQGGPQGTISQYFSYRWNFFLMASEGYVVIAPNRRGMPGFGQKWNDDISLDWGGQAMKDLLAATDDLSNESYIDKSKIAAVGASFGGYSVFWLAGNHNKRFSSFISHCGVFNLESMYGSTEELFFPNWEFGGPYWEAKNQKGYIQHSPHKYVQNWNTPMLIITGVNDFRVPYTQSLEAYTAARMNNVHSEILVFPEENHWVLGIQNAYVWQREFFDFLKRTLK